MPELRDFHVELRGLGEAVGLSLETIDSEARNLVKGVESLSQVGVVADFYVDADAHLRQLRSDIKTASDACHRCLSFYGESSSTDAGFFFSLVVQFIAAFKVRCSLLDLSNFINPNRSTESRRGKQEEAECATGEESVQGGAGHLGRRFLDQPFPRSANRPQRGGADV